MTKQQMIESLRELVKDLEAENQKLREQLDAANYHIQLQNSVIAGDTE